MAVTTNPRQPIVYDMMLLAHALIRLKGLQATKVARHHRDYPEKQIFFESACTKIRGLAQFISTKGRRGLIRITDPDFGGVADQRFVKDFFDPISKYVSHTDEQRWKKDPEYRSLTTTDVLAAGRQILDYLKPLFDSLRTQLKGDAADWYAMFESLYGQME